MILKALTLENFKGIRDPVRIEFAPITLLFGPNNAGMSTIIQALHYAREIFERGNTDPGRTLLGGDALDLGGFDSLVHNHDRSRTIKMGFELDVSKEDLAI
jgi:AAA15 family ATPase/GTPase